MSAQDQQTSPSNPSSKAPSHAPAEAGRLGMILFLAALGVLFAAGMVGYLVVRLRAEDWPPPGSPRLPPGLWISTGILLLSSLTMHIGLSGIRRGLKSRLRGGLYLTFLLGVVFLLSQLISWRSLIGAQLPAQANLYAFTFYMLTGLHGAHVLGGLIPLGITAVRAGRGRYTAQDHTGVDYISMYWHFLDVVWLIMFTVMVIAA